MGEDGEICVAGFVHPMCSAIVKYLNSPLSCLTDDHSTEVEKLIERCIPFSRDIRDIGAELQPHPG
jgi:hypothetical protein